MASQGQESVHFNLEWDECGDEFLDDIDFHLVESLMEKESSAVQDVSIPEKTTRLLTAVENMMPRGNSISITNLFRVLCLNQVYQAGFYLQYHLRILILFLSMKIRTLRLKQLRISI